MTTITKPTDATGNTLLRLTKSSAVWVWLLPRNIAIAIMKTYRLAISPLYGQVCRYHPSCSSYSLQAYQHHGFLKGLGLTVWRLLRCNPFSSGGIDDVRLPTRTSFEITRHGFVSEAKRKA
jgi:putative membrane protein insertion efficiency factor